MLSFRCKLLLLQFGTVLATTLLLGGLSHLLFIDSISALQQHHLQQHAEETAKDIGYYLQGLSESIESLELEEFHRKYGDLPLEKHFARHFTKLSGSFPVVSYLNREGRETIKLLNGRPSDDYFNQLYNPAVQAAMDEPNRVQLRVQIQNVELSQPVLQLAITRIGYFGDEFLGTLLLSLPLSELTPYLETDSLGGGFISLLDAERRLLFHPRQESRFIPLRSALPQAPARAELLGEDLFLASAGIPATDWLVVTAIPFAEYRAELTRLKQLAVLVCVLVSLLTGLFSLLLVRHLTRNIQLLTRHAEQVGAGQLDQRLALHTGDEFSQLGHAFNSMTENISRHRSGREALQQILQSIIDPLLVTDLQGQIRQVNQATLELLGCSEQRLLGRPLADLFPEPPALLQSSNFATELLHGQVKNLETTVQTCLGERIPILFSSSPGSSAAEDIGIVGIIKDISMRAAARQAREQALREAEEAHRKIDALLRSVGDGLVVTDLRGRVLLQNQPARRLLGTPQHSPLIPALRRLTSNPHPELPATFDLELPATAEQPTRYLQAHSSPVLDQQGEHSGLVTLLRDVTRERTLEQMKNEFISTAAHELRTPLTSILGYSELLLDQSLEGSFSPEQKHDFLREIHQRSEVLACIVDDLLNISRIESGQAIPLEIQPTPVEPLLTKVVEQFRLSHPEQQFALQLRPAILACDGNKLRQVMENLLSNAVKYSPQPGTIRIDGEQQSGGYLIQVEDQGIGMNQEQLAKVFDKFFRADFSNTCISGLGIGMSIVQQIIEGHQGDIQLESTPGQGTRVSIRLPLASG